jgi:hypothetical protein
MISSLAGARVTVETFPFEYRPHPNAACAEGIRGRA